MKFHYLFTLLPLLGIVSCGQPNAEPESPAALTLLDLRLRDSLQLVRDDYADLQSWRALDRVYRLRDVAATQDDSVSDNTKTEIYQHLAIMHYERGYEDSVIHYAALADRHLGEDPPPLLFARQLLCEAYLKYTEWEWLEMDMIAALGLAVLREHGLDHDGLHSQLLLTQAYARWKYANAWLEEEEFDKVAGEVESLVQQAIRQYRAAGGARERHAWEDWALLAARLPHVSEGDLRAALDTLAGTGNPEDPIYAHPHRLMAYWHFRRGEPDSMRYHYERLLEQTPFYRLENPREANYILKLNSLERGDYRRALALSIDDLRLSNCARPAARLTVAVGDTSFSERYICPYLDLELVKVYLGRYRATADTADLHRAFALAQVTMDRYAVSFPSQRDEGVINKLVELGDVLLDVCLDAALEMQRQQPEEAMDAVFRAMELSQSLLLLRDLATIGEADNQQKWRSLHASLERYKRSYRADFSLPVANLREFRRLDTRYREEKKLSRPAMAASAHLTGATKLAAVRGRLEPQQALLMSTELHDRILLLCIDRDTAFTYQVPTAIIPRIDSLRQMLTGGRVCSPGEYANVAYQIYAPLLAPLEGLSRKPSELLFVPSPALSEVPLSALTVAPGRKEEQFTDLRYVVDEYAVRYLPSWRVELLNGEKRKGVQTEAADIGVWTHPQLVGYAAGLTDDLRRAGGGWSVETLAPQTGTFLSQAPGLDIIHLTVHARGNTGQLHENYLHLNDRDSLNGVVVAQLPLSARLVVLAACATSTGFKQAGEGTFSLRRSFHLAGVPDVISSLYDIPAAATVAVLKSFYRQLASGSPPATALAEAQRTCRAGKLSQRYANPRYWAGLVAG
ncbi:CHAT domain-containing protein [Neolewinella litorea]|uniref:CHAT domain-containing protein n=1 Tax=Neolewinella litorea TaxID=2562452 RepID=A0A4S4NNU0_9BACT|nr:CHAT domain-containing protein [Neolewinella litorea]THH37900.1 CHAT domain-containing protein [Neolewinella litorea]